MKYMKHLIAMLALMWLSVPALAAQGSIEVRIEVKKIEVTTVYGEKKTKEVDVKTVLPGDELIYTIYFKNIDRVPVDNIEITDPIPKGTVYKQGSAFGAGTEITFSVDGGKTYAGPDDLNVTGKDGAVRKAQAADYTDIRWIFTPKLPPEKTGTAQFRVIVK
ncbi:MAG: hypothetical protein OEZ10_10350 [Gammaproteobacteria bacterium]|nr:hypothetical protein [Gammaproteobacteria bacterium]